MTYERKSRIVGDFMQPRAEREQEQERRIAAGQLALPELPPVDDDADGWTAAPYTDREARAIQAVLLTSAWFDTDHPCPREDCDSCRVLAVGWDAIYRTLAPARRQELMDTMIEVGTRPPGA